MQGRGGLNMEHIFDTPSHGMVTAPPPRQQPLASHLTAALLCCSVQAWNGVAPVSCLKGLLDAAQLEHRRLAGSPLPGP